MLIHFSSPRCRVCLVTLSPNHEIIKSKKSIKNIDFSFNEGVSRLDNKVTGKWKKVSCHKKHHHQFICIAISWKGGQKVNPNSILCRITCDDDQVFDVKACINGTIVEINTKLLDNFNILTEKVFNPWLKLIFFIKMFLFNYRPGLMVMSQSLFHSWEDTQQRKNRFWVAMNTSL